MPSPLLAQLIEAGVKVAGQAIKWGLDRHARNVEHAKKANERVRAFNSGIAALAKGSGEAAAVALARLGDIADSRLLRRREETGSGDPGKPADSLGSWPVDDR